MKDMKVAEQIVTGEVRKGEKIKSSNENCLK